MLVLSRRPNESLQIGDDIRIDFVRVSGENVRIAIDAPKHIPIWRSEVYESILAEGEILTEGTRDQDAMRSRRSDTSDA